MSYDYDPQNVFAKMLRNEIPCKPVLETEHSLAFHDIAPQAPDHVLVIPRGPYVCFDHFAQTATAEEIADFVRTIGEVCRLLKIQPFDQGMGYRMISNAGPHGVQEVPHLHVHILAGRPLGRMVQPAT